MKSEQEQLKKASKEAGGALREKQGDKNEKSVSNALGRNTIPKEALGLSDKMVEGIYGQAYRLYNTGKFKDARQLFRLLIMINATEPKYLLGLAACYHMEKNYDAALRTYAICSVIDPENPIPHYHASDCYLKEDDKASALIELTMAIKRSGGRAEYQTLKSRAEMSAKSIQKEIEEAEKEDREEDNKEEKKT